MAWVCRRLRMLPGLVEDEGRRSARDAEQFEALADRMIVLDS